MYKWIYIINCYITYTQVDLYNNINVYTYIYILCCIVQVLFIAKWKWANDSKTWIQRANERDFIELIVGKRGIILSNFRCAHVLTDQPLKLLLPTFVKHAYGLNHDTAELFNLQINRSPAIYTSLQRVAANIELGDTNPRV